MVIDGSKAVPPPIAGVKRSRRGSSKLAALDSNTGVAKDVSAAAPAPVAVAAPPLAMPPGIAPQIHVPVVMPSVAVADAPVAAKPVLMVDTDDQNISISESSMFAYFHSVEVRRLPRPTFLSLRFIKQLAPCAASPSA